MIVGENQMKALRQMEGAGGRAIWDPRHGWYYPERPKEKVRHPGGMPNLHAAGLIEPKVPRTGRGIPREPEEFIITVIGKHVLRTRP